jgi:hypothetical protein
MNTTFWNRWKVFIIGLASSIVFALQELLSKTQAEQDTKVYLYAVLMAALSFVATQWRGQGMTLIGIVGTLAATFVSLNQTGNFSWTQFIIYGLAAVLSAVAPPPKPQTYETDKDIVQAKLSPPINQVSDTSQLPTSPKDGSK